MISRDLCQMEINTMMGENGLGLGLEMIGTPLTGDTGATRVSSRNALGGGTAYAKALG